MPPSVSLFTIIYSLRAARYSSEQAENAPKFDGEADKCVRTVHAIECEAARQEDGHCPEQVKALID